MFHALCFLCSFLTIARIASAQCQWASGSGFPSTNGNVNAILRLPNGDVIVGGDFTAAGNVMAKSIARWNGVSWFPLGAGLNYGPVNHPYANCDHSMVVPVLTANDFQCFVNSFAAGCL